MRVHTPEKARRAVRKKREAGEPVEFAYDWKNTSGTSYEMPLEMPTDKMVEKAKEAVEHAQSVRKAYARKRPKGTPQRETDIELAIRRLKNAMGPVRRQMGKFAYTEFPKDREIIEKVSLEIQRERRKLWKMQDRKKKQPKVNTRKYIEKALEMEES